jgi:protein-tyrosine-phosphatase
MAQVFFEHYVRRIPEIVQYAVESAGIGAREGQKSSSGARFAVKAKGFSLEDHEARLVTQAIVDGAVAIIGATSAHETFLREHFSNLPEICTSFAAFGGEIADPCGGDMESYGKIADEIEQKLPLVVEFLRKEFNDH